MSVPAGLRYAKSHEWAKLDGARVRVGLSAFAVAEIKDVVFVDLPAAGTAARGGQSFGAIETVKAAFDLYAPVSGTVHAVNGALAGSPETVTRDPYGEGWMIEIEAANPEEAAKAFAGLLDEAAYAAHCTAQKH
ncbi:MAG: glycine cleavage system protein GcvH [Candidatus Coatesbacteria bacterium]|mgnify:CR=1 FL=1